MSLAETLQTQPLGTVLVTGGSGGLGNQILILLKARQVSSQLHSLDLRKPATPIENVHYHAADLTDERAIHLLFQTVRPNVVIHCASPRFDAAPDIMHKVNVKGTNLLLTVGQASGTAAFVYTSSASVISDARSDLRNADETYPLVLGAQQPEFYTHTKAVAELAVLSHNRPPSHPEFLTCAIRPSGIFGQGDSWVLPAILDASRQGRTRVQLGQNTNLFDFTENRNVAHAHCLAAAALVREHEGLGRGRGTEEREMEGEEDGRVDGEAFFITNDEPLPFWDFTRAAWRLAGDRTEAQDVWVLSRAWAIGIAAVLEWVFWAAFGSSAAPPLTRTKVRLSCMTRYYSIAKAKTRLGYRPLVGLKDGLRRGVEDWMKREGMVVE